MRTKFTALAVAFVAALAVGSTTAHAQQRHQGGGDRGHASRGHDNGPRGHDWRGGDRHDGRGGWHYRGYYPQPYYGRPWPSYATGYYWPSERARWLCYNRGICPAWYDRPGPSYYEPGLSFDLNLR